MALAVDSLLDNRYRIVRPLSAGGMGSVYVAHDQRLGDPCAVKVLLHGDRAPTNDLLRRKFDDEKTILTRLHHAGIPRIRDFVVTDEHVFLVMDLIDGPSLEQTLDEHLRQHGGPLPPSMVVEYACQILDVLVYLHDLDPPVIHRDIKPANVIIQRADNRAVLVDFGLARPLEASPRTQTLLATLNYAPFEQIQGHAEQRSDLYALGATMFQLMSGVCPQPLDTPPLRDAWPHADEALAALVDRATARDKEQRFETARAMRAALAQWQQYGSSGLPTVGAARQPVPHAPPSLPTTAAAVGPAAVGRAAVGPTAVPATPATAGRMPPPAAAATTASPVTIKRMHPAETAELERSRGRGRFVVAVIVAAWGWSLLHYGLPNSDSSPPTQAHHHRASHNVGSDDDAADGNVDVNVNSHGVDINADGQHVRFNAPDASPSPRAVRP
jgi:serine/threonine-protein kinase